MTQEFSRSSEVHFGKQVASHVSLFASYLLPWFVYEDRHWHARTCLPHGTSSSNSLISHWDIRRGCNSTKRCLFGHWNFCKVKWFISSEWWKRWEKFLQKWNWSLFCVGLQKRSFKSRPAATGTWLKLCMRVPAQGCVSKTKTTGRLLTAVSLKKCSGRIM